MAALGSARAPLFGDVNQDRPRQCGHQKPRKAKVHLGFWPFHLGFPWLLGREKAKESQQKPRKAKGADRRAIAVPAPAVGPARPPPDAVDVYVC
jgi:hypothetical protein